MAQRGKEERKTQKIFVRVRCNLNRIRRDVELLSQLAQQLKKEGRLMGG